ncbi:uncharacterized protein LOC111015032 [Momordica charantia]|uniref:Uncharacterized protein LOC111015032 n=1 Tax=Momordica charantia TaxID=3673 RepID=A0A6J1CV15_MOMCH|nr:uncharacterized protein LOC111015032 [Momordica charantia]
MASIFAAPPSQLNLCSRRSSSNRRALLPSIVGVKLHSSGFPVPSFRFRHTKGLELSQRSFSITASNSSDGNSIKEEATGDAQGPPFLTILAGFFVFSLIIWMISSAFTSLIGLVVKLIPAK